MKMLITHALLFIYVLVETLGVYVDGIVATF